MATITEEVTIDLSIIGLRVFKGGRIERLSGEEIVPASVHPETGVQSKDVTIDPEKGVSARLYIPKITNPDHKLPLLVYFHGGGFCIESAFSPTYHNYLNSLVAEANVVVVSADYRKAPEHPLPAAYDDSWANVKWVASHSAGGDGKEAWLKDHADFDRVFFAGDSAGGNIAHHMGTRVGSEKLTGLNLIGVALFCPYFWKKFDDGNFDIADRLWKFVYPQSTGSDDPLLNPGNDPNVSALACKKLLVIVAEQDFLKAGGRYYYEVLGKSGWGGVTEIFEEAGEGHVYHLLKPTSDKAVALLKKFASFLNEV